VIEAMRYVTGLANLEFVVTPDALVVQPIGAGGAAVAPVPLPNVAAADAPNGAGAESAALKKAEKIIIPRIELREATLAETVDFLRVKTREIDPDGKGINILVKGQVPNSARITLSLTNIPLIEALRYAAGLTEFKLKIEPNVLVLESPNSPDATGSERTKDDAEAALQKQRDALAINKERLEALKKKLGEVQLSSADLAEVEKVTKKRSEELKATLSTKPAEPPGEPAPANRDAGNADPGDMFLNAYMAMQKGEKLEAEGRFQAALESVEKATRGLDQISAAYPSWQPQIVAYRKDKVAQTLARLQAKFQ
jgi:hypothetical protein